MPEWQATLDALQELPEIGAEAPVGYGGMNMGTAIGVPLTAVEPRITAAVFGGVFVYDALTETARQITIPIEFLLQWDDEHIHRQIRSRVVRRLRLEGEDAARQRGQALEVPGSRSTARPGSSPAISAGPHVSGLT